MPIARAFEPPDVSNPPFKLGVDCVVDLPMPPSVNRIWRRLQSRVVLAPAYDRWKRQADLCAIADRDWRSKPRMADAFKALILLDRARRAGDVDNRVKAVLDWAQSRELIKNDKLCEEITARWVATVEAPKGCRLILRAVA